MAQPASLDAFERVNRGDAAPAWVREGVLHAWALPAGAVVELIVLSENITFRVSMVGVPRLVVRLGRPGYAASTAHLRSELLWVDALRRDIAAPTPAPVRGADGEFVQRIVDPGGAAWTAVAFEFAPGTILEERSELAPHYVEIGRLTALLHGHARDWSPPAGFERFDWDVPALVGPSARWGDWRDASLSETERSMLERAESAALARLADAVHDSPGPVIGLIHGDLRPSNVMAEGASLRIIDFDDCGFGYYLYDFGAALSFYEHRSEAMEMAANWVAGYQQVRPLGAAELDAAAALSMLRRLTMLGWQLTHRADALPEDLWCENQPGTLEVAGRYLSDPGWLLER